MKRHGIVLNNEINFNVDWLDLGEKLFQAILHGSKATQGDISSGAEAAFSILSARKSISVSSPTGTKALNIIILCFALAFDDVCAADTASKANLKPLAHNAIEKLRMAILNSEISISADFFESPQASEPYRLVRDEFIKERRHFRTSTDEDEQVLAYKFDIAFRKAIWELWKKRNDIFESVARELDSPALQTADFDRQWLSYRELLKDEFFVRPVFGQEISKISLSQMYVPLRCIWTEEKFEDSSTANRSKIVSHKEFTLHVQYLEEELTNWIDNSDENDWLRLIGGGPGSGKSTSAKAIAAALASREDVRPLFVPLQRLQVGKSLRENINLYFTERTGSPFTVGPLERRNIEYAPPLILIFDGLDEIARPGDSADEIARDMVDRVKDLRSDLSGYSSARHKVLMTGRMPSFQAARRRQGSTGNEALEVMDFLPVGTITTQIRLGDVQNERRFGRIQSERSQEIAAKDQRVEWWKNYSSAVGKPAEVPQGLRRKELESLSAEPLLCYLLALSGYIDTDFEEAARNPNKVYERLLSDVWKRGWGGGRAGKGKDLSKEDFDLLFEAMAVAAWHGGDERVATMERFKHAIKVMKCEEIYKDFSEKEGDDVSNLAVNFYLKRPDEGSKGFEFTHKSFGEYLTARAILRLARSAHLIANSSCELALLDWLHSIGEGELTFELLKFMQYESLLGNKLELQEIHKSFAQMINAAMNWGFPANQIACRTWREAESRQRKAELMALCVFHCLSRSLSEGVSEPRSEKIHKTQDLFALGNLIHRLRRMRNSDVPSMKLFTNIDAPESYLLGQELIEADFANTNLSNSVLNYSTLRSANFYKANLSLCRMSYCIANEANFSYADLQRVEAREANFEGAVFVGSDLRKANFKGAKLKGADFTGADLTGVDFGGADLRKVKLRKATLSGVKCGGAIMDTKLKNLLSTSQSN